MISSCYRASRLVRCRQPVYNVMVVHLTQEPRKEDKSSDPVPPGKYEMFSKGYFQDLLWKNQTGVLFGGSIVGFAVISKLLYGAGDYFVHLSSGLALYYGFSVGAIATGASAGGAYLIAKSLRSDPEAAARLAMIELKKNKDLVNVLGPNAAPSEVKTYATTSSGFGVVGARPRFFHPQVHLAFQLKGSSSPAIVTAVCTKKGLFEHKCEYVGIDWTTPAGQTLSLTLLGEEAAFGLKNTVKDHLKLLTAKSPKFR